MVCENNSQTRMAVLCGMHTIQYSARRLFVHKLFISCILRCLASRACDWMIPALSAVLLIYSFQSRPAFLPCRSSRQHSGVHGLPTIGHRTLPKIWVGFLCVLLCSNGKMETRHHAEGSFGSEFPAICNHCVVMTTWSRQTSRFCEKFLFFFGKTTPYAKIKKNLLRKFSSRHRSTLLRSNFGVAVYTGHRRTLLPARD